MGSALCHEGVCYSVNEDTIVNLQTKIRIFYAQTYYRSSAVGNGRELLFIGSRKRGPEARGNF
jgi:hypothetical protein